VIMASRVILLSASDERRVEPSMRFRLTYEGELRPTQGEPRGNQANPLASHKQTIRKEFHGQLKHLWSIDRFLHNHRVFPEYGPLNFPVGSFTGVWGGGEERKISLIDYTAGRYHEFGYRFVPLVREEISLSCSLSILFLRRDIPGSVIKAGDLDNRVKTIIDALRRPRNANDLVGHENPGPGEDPFYCLLEDDSQVTHLEVETDTLLDPITTDNADQRRAHLIITVEIRPMKVTMFNLSFA
jgi:hypothetical protein